jgi:hypothetical protein
LEDFAAVSGQANTYRINNTGYVEQVFDDGDQLTEKTSIATVQATAGTWWWDSDIDALYVHATGSDDLTATTIPHITSGVDWDDFKDRMRDAAMEEMDTMLGRRYPVPLIPRLIKHHSSNDYEAPIRQLCAMLTCRNIIRRMNPTAPMAAKLEKMIYNPDPLEGEVKGMMNKLVDGDWIRQDEISPREVGAFNVVVGASNVGAGYVWFLGKYRGAKHEWWRLQIDTLGAPGTATYKLSLDQGSNWDWTTEETFNTDNNDRRIHLARGVYAIFFGTFAVNDIWDIEVFPSSDVSSVAKISSTEIIRI